jgi:hypothetical protein
MSLKKHVRGFVILNKYKSQGKAVQMTVNSKEEISKGFAWISFINLATGQQNVLRHGAAL